MRIGVDGQTAPSWANLPNTAQLPPDSLPSKRRADPARCWWGKTACSMNILKFGKAASRAGVLGAALVAAAGSALCGTLW